MEGFTVFVSHRPLSDYCFCFDVSIVRFNFGLHHLESTKGKNCHNSHLFGAYTTHIPKSTPQRVSFFVSICLLRESLTGSGDGATYDGTGPGSERGETPEMGVGQMEKKSEEKRREGGKTRRGKTASVGGGGFKAWLTTELSLFFGCFFAHFCSFFFPASNGLPPPHLLSGSSFQLISYSIVFCVFFFVSVCVDLAGVG